MLTTAAALRGATKHYKTFALGPVDLAVPAGSILGLIGENGAGKTTALKLLCGAIRPDGGSVELLGGSPADPAIRARIGVVFEDAYFPDCFNAACVGKSMAGIFGKRWDTAKFDALVRRFELDGSKKIKEYSRGMRMKLSLATALAHDPELADPGRSHRRAGSCGARRTTGPAAGLHPGRAAQRTDEQPHYQRFGTGRRCHRLPASRPAVVLRK